MPGETAAQAVQNYLAPIRATLSCITDRQITNRGGDYIADHPHQFLFAGRPPVAELSGTDVCLFVSQHYSIVQLQKRKPLFKVKTEGYTLTDEAGVEILAYHWHPLRNPQDPITYPHLHFNRGAQVGRRELRDGHIPSGRIALESLVLYLVETPWGVQPIRADWREVLTRNLEIFERFKSW